MKGMIRFSVLGSGSNGNACYVETDNVRVLIDAGFSCREIERRLKLLGRTPSDLDALIITHEHMDHIKGAGPLARRFQIPVYANHKTFQNGLKVLGNLTSPVVIHTGQTLSMDGLTIETFTKCHDAADPIGLVLSSGGIRIGLVTDLGRSTRMAEDRLKGCRVLIMEFNHDLDMLERGPYPLALKRRIRGSEGHLSNNQAGDLLRTVCDGGLRHLVLAHLSEINNNPEAAYNEARTALEDRGIRDTSVLVSRQDDPIPLIGLE